MPSKERADVEKPGSGNEVTILEGQRRRPAAKPGLPAMARDLELAGVLLHQLLEASERHNFAERRVHSLVGLAQHDRREHS
jgi:hypothetical protein